MFHGGVLRPDLQQSFVLYHIEIYSSEWGLQGIILPSVIGYDDCMSSSFPMIERNYILFNRTIDNL